jgi:hypothetical protein
MGRKGLLRSGIALAITGLIALFRETLFWVLGKALDWATAGHVKSVQALAVTIPWVNLIALILVAGGVFLSVKASRMQRAQEGNENIKLLANRAGQIATYIVQYRDTSSFNRPRLPNLSLTLMDGIAVLMAFEDAGFPIPDFSSPRDGNQIAVGMQIYFGLMYALLRDGNVKRARDDGEGIKNAAQKACDELSPGQWWTNDGY